MPIKTTLIALVLAVSPTLSLAMCGALDHETTAASCADGFVWDTDAQACVKRTTS